MTAAINLVSWIDQFDEDTTLGRPDLEIEMSEEFIPTNPSMSWCPRGNTASAKSGVVTPSTVNSATRIQ
jgi:hypothetical protein